MISLSECRKLLGKKGEKYSDEQLELIRQFLTKMAKTNAEIIKEHKNKKDEED